MGAAFPYYRDAFGHSAIYGNFGDAGNADLVINGVSQGGWGVPFGQWVVPAEAADYEINVVTEKFNAGSFFAPNWRMSTLCYTSFKFRSAKPASNDTVAVLPLLLPFYDMQLDEYNLAPALADFKIGIAGRGQQDYDGGRIVSAKMWIATDEYGESWSPVPVVASGSGYLATVDNTSAAGGYVSIKVELTYERGASVTQTVIKAYGVKQKHPSPQKRVARSSPQRDRATRFSRSVSSLQCTLVHRRRFCMVRSRKLVLSEHERASKLADLGYAMRLRREDLGLRQDELAALAGCSTRFVSTVERAKPSIQMDKLMDLLNVLGLDLELKLGNGRLVTEPSLTAPTDDEV